jgi:tetratricopeptide (TPR) repeat protein
MEKSGNQDRLGALKLLTLATQRDSSFAIAYLQLARALGDLGRVKEQAGMCTRAFQLSSRASEKERMYIEAGYALTIERDRAKQIAVFEAMKKRFPDEKQVRFELGVAYVSNGQQDRAIAELEEGLRLDPDYVPAVNQLAYLYKDQGNMARARELLTHYAAIAPEEPNPYDSWGDFYVTTGDLDSALMMFREAVKHKSEFFPSSCKIGLVLALREEYDPALAELHAVWQHFPSAGTMAFSGMVAYLAGRPSQGEESYSRANQTWKSQGATALLLYRDISRGWRLLAADRPRDAAQVVRQSRDILSKMAPRDRARFWSAGQLLLVESDLLLHHVDSARERLAAISDGLGRLDRWTRLVMEYEMGVSAANILLAAGKADSAVRLARSIQLPPNPPLFSPNLGFLNLAIGHRTRYSVIARACLALGDTLGAVRELEQQVRVYPDRPDLHFTNPLLHYDLAVLLDRLGERERASQEYTKFLTVLAKSERDHQELQYARQRLQELSN